MYQFERMTPEERKKCGSKGGTKSGETRRRKRAMKETLEVLLSMPMKNGKIADIEGIKNFADLKGKNINVQEALVISMIQKAMKGDIRAAEFVRDTVGQNPTAKVDLRGSVDVANPYDELTVEELRSLARKCESEES